MEAVACAAGRDHSDEHDPDKRYYDTRGDGKADTMARPVETCEVSGRVGLDVSGDGKTDVVGLPTDTTGDGHEDALLYLLQTMEGARLAEASTNEFGARADWKAEQLAANGRVRTLLNDLGLGGEDRSRVFLYARRKLAPYMQQDRQAAAAEAAATLAAPAAAAEEIAALRTRMPMRHLSP